MGTLVKVSPYLIKRRKTHFHTFPYGISIILGCNGNIWISPVTSEDYGLTGGYVQNLEEVIFFLSIFFFDICKIIGIKYQYQYQKKNLFNFCKFFTIQVISMEIRTAIARTANCINILAKYNIPIYDTTIILAYEASNDYEVYN